MDSYYEAAGPGCRDGYGARGVGPTSVTAGNTAEFLKADAARVSLTVGITNPHAAVNECAIVILGEGSQAVRAAVLNASQPSVTLRVQEFGEAIQRSVSFSAVTSDHTCFATELLKQR